MCWVCGLGGEQGLQRGQVALCRLHRSAAGTCVAPVDGLAGTSMCMRCHGPGKWWQKHSMVQARRKL